MRFPAGSQAGNSRLLPQLPLKQNFSKETVHKFWRWAHPAYGGSDKLPKILNKKIPR